MLEKLIARHCGPALAEIKPANIAACDKLRIHNVHGKIKKLNSELGGKDIYIEILCDCDQRVLVMVYRRSVLEKHLKKPEMSCFLRKFGYPGSNEADECIAFLKRRLRETDFPHEIGVFLGYPLHDIYGFINNRDEGCLLTGEWKVYKDAEGAKKLFSRYEACRNAIVKRVESGRTLAQIFCAA